MQGKSRRIGLKILCPAVVILAIYLWFSFSLFLGLQVRPLYGNMGMLVTLLLVAVYVYFGFIRKRRISRVNGDQRLRGRRQYRTAGRVLFPDIAKQCQAAIHHPGDRHLTRMRRWRQPEQVRECL